ncbi:MAG: hypothetical protein ACI86M_002215 [Saprospiraceae bacterium]|jgi:hypothetical protein
MIHINNVMCRFISFNPRLLALIVGFMLFSIENHCQISVTNPSFEDEPADATTPQGWHPCDNMTTPDIFPGFWGVYNEPSNGNTYVGIITRENGSYEQFGQRLSSKLKKGQCYRTSIDLAHSIIYSGYNKPIQVRIYIGSSKCNKNQLIFESPVVKSMKWSTHLIEFVPNGEHEYFIFQAHYSDEPFNHKGNILLDNLRPFVVCGNT